MSLNWTAIFKASNTSFYEELLKNRNWINVRKALNESHSNELFGERLEDNTADHDNGKVSDVDPCKTISTWIAYINCSFPLIFTIIGTMGNALTIIALLRMKDKLPSLGLLLIALAVSDTIILYSEAIHVWTFEVFSFDLRDQSTFLCKMFSFAKLMAYPLSSWLLVLISIERVVNVQWPFRANTICGRKPILCYIGILVMTIGIFNFLEAAEHELRETYIWPENKLTLFCRYSEFGFKLITEAIIRFFVPFAILASANLFLVYKLTRIRRRVTCRAGSRHAKNLRNSSVLILLVTLQFLLCLGSYNVFKVLPGTFYVSWQCETRGQILLIYRSISWTLTYANASFNFFSYVLSGRRFRQEVKRLLCCMVWLVV